MTTIQQVLSTSAFVLFVIAVLFAFTWWEISNKLNKWDFDSELRKSYTIKHLQEDKVDKWDQVDNASGSVASVRQQVDRLEQQVAKMQTAKPVSTRAKPKPPAKPTANTVELPKEDQ